MYSKCVSGLIGYTGLEARATAHVPWAVCASYNKAYRLGLSDGHYYSQSQTLHVCSALFIINLKFKWYTNKVIVLDYSFFVTKIKEYRLYFDR